MGVLHGATTLVANDHLLGYPLLINHGLINHGLPLIVKFDLNHCRQMRQTANPCFEL